MFGKNKHNKEEKTIKNSREDVKRERFKRVASRRVQDVINKLRLLRNCANIGNYSYTEEDKRKIFSVVEEEWKKSKAEFNKHSTKENKFSFD